MNDEQRAAWRKALADHHKRQRAERARGYRFRRKDDPFRNAVGVRVARRDDDRGGGT